MWEKIHIQIWLISSFLYIIIIIIIIIIFFFCDTVANTEKNGLFTFLPVHLQRLNHVWRTLQLVIMHVYTQQTEMCVCVQMDLC